MTDIAIEASQPLEVDKIELPKLEEQLVDVNGQHVILLEDCVAFMVGDEKSQIEKRITYEDFNAIVGAVVNHRNEQSMEGFQLPSNCFYFARSGSDIHLSCYYSERIAEVKHLTKKYVIKTPNLIISHKLFKGGDKTWKIEANRSRYFCTNAKVGNLPKAFIDQVEHSKHIYLMPFPNTYSEGALCFGGNSMPSQFTDNNLRGLDWYYQVLFESPFNNDLGIRALRDEPSIEGWFKKLSDVAKANTDFPYESIRGYKAI
jgi:hypothetical protein